MSQGAGGEAGAGNRGNGGGSGAAASAGRAGGVGSGGGSGGLGGMPGEGSGGGAGAPGGAGGGLGSGGSGGGGGAGDGPCHSTVIPLPPTGCPDVSGAPLGVASHPGEGANHLVLCSTACYGTMPPSSGNHYPNWPVYKSYDQPVPWGFLVHGLEHGAVIVVYNCPCGCPDEVAAAKAWIASLPPDAACGDPGPPPRVVLAPDPTLDVRWAASAWNSGGVDGGVGWTLRANSFDRDAFQSFFTDHYGMSAELVCDKGLTDGSVAGWCN